MLQILHDTKVNFMGARKVAYTFSALLLLAGIVSLVMKGGPRPGVDFAGGTLLELRFSQKVAADDLRAAAGQAGMGDAEIQAVEASNDALFRVPEAIVPQKNEEGQVESGPSIKIQQALSGKYPGIAVEILRQEVVGPKVGRELRMKALWSILFSIVAIMIYVWWRFDRWEFGLGAATALFHDILITIGIMSILNKEFTLTVLAAYLTIAGYSINDTIVVFDRVRENIGLKRRMSLFDLMNMSINQTLSRTILTVLTVMMTAAALFFLGGQVIHDFSLAMLIGVGFGTYSSVFVASALALDIDNWRQKRITARLAAKSSRAAAAKAAGKPAKDKSSRSTVAAR